MKKTLVSIIIPTRNSEKYIKNCLKSIKKTKYNPIEIVVVDQQSSDNTVAIAKSLGAKVLKVTQPKYYSPPSYSRNYGAKRAKGEILYHLDSDMYFVEDVISETVEILSDQNISTLVVHEKDIAHNFWGKCKAFERSLYFGNNNIESARIVRKSVFQRVGGYDETITTGEDFEIHKRYELSFNIGYTKKQVYHDIRSFGFTSNLKKKYYYGKSAYHYFQKTHRKPHSIILTIISSYINNYKKILFHPILFLGTLFQKFFEFIAAYAGYLSGNRASLLRSPRNI